jgi:hypothetical protein
MRSGLPTPAKRAVQASGRQRELVGAVAEIVARVPRAAVEVKVAIRIARDTIVGCMDLRAQSGYIESDGTSRCHWASS